MQNVQNNVAAQLQARKNTEVMMKRFKLDINDYNKGVNKTEDLKKVPPLLVTAQVAVNTTVHDQTGSGTPLRKGSVMVMPIGVFQQMKRESGGSKRKVLKPFRRPFTDFFNRYDGQNLDNKKLLIIRGGGFGDLMFLQPLVKKLKEQYPTCKITLASYGRFLPIVVNWPEGLLDNIVPVPFAKEIMQTHDYHLVFEGLIERNKEAERENCYDLHSTMAGVDIDMTDNKYKLELDVTKEIENEIKSKLPEDFVIIQLRASSPIRMMKEEKWVEIINGLVEMGKTVAILDRKQLKPYYDAFIKKHELDTEKVVNLSEYSSTINHAVAIISKASGVIGVDSAYVHIAEALGVKGVGIYSSFLGDLRVRYYENVDFVQAEEGHCDKQPCFYHHEAATLCPSIKAKQEPACSMGVNTQEVLDKYKKLIEFKG
ncbi:MAG: glycosyltransferase family 9 protein [Candidatus Peribacteraceae bacterium]|nr:glycosyltransferase family 9 protein [Candidatus Peribacteraceae bacterium]